MGMIGLCGPWVRIPELIRRVRVGEEEVEYGGLHGVSRDGVVD